jgi:hypothetical protein
MPRVFQRRSHGPVYREVLSAAFRSAWTHKQYWPLSFFASMLLSAGAYDVVLNAVRTIGDQSASLMQGSRMSMIGPAMASTWASLPAADILTGLQAVITVALILVTFAAMSCISQGGLVFAIGTGQEEKPTLKQALGVGGRAFWPIAALNALSLTLLWILRFLIAFPLYLLVAQDTTLLRVLYMCSFVVFLALSFFVTIVHIFALNAMILQGARLSEAVVRGYTLFKKHWLVSIETAALLCAVALGVGVLWLGMFLLALIPLFAAVISAAVVQSQGLLYGTMGVALGLFFIAVFSATAFVTHLQYATWTLLFRKMGEGGVVAKIHRVARDIFHLTGVPR